MTKATETKTGIIITASGNAWQDSPDRTEVFRIVETHDAAGELLIEPRVKIYDMPAKPNAGLALQFLKRARREGGEMALSWLMEVSLGADAYDDLADQPDLEQDDLKNIMGAIQKIALGGLEAPKGN